MGRRRDVTLWRRGKPVSVLGAGCRTCAVQAVSSGAWLFLLACLLASCLQHARHMHPLPYGSLSSLSTSPTTWKSPHTHVGCITCSSTYTVAPWPMSFLITACICTSRSAPSVAWLIRTVCSGPVTFLRPAALAKAPLGPGFAPGGPLTGTGPPMMPCRKEGNNRGRRQCRVDEVLHVDPWQCS